MEKIDRLGWAAGVSFVSYGVRVGIRVNKPEFLDRLVNRFPPVVRPSNVSVVELLYSLILGGPGARPGIRKFNVLYRNTEKVMKTLNDDEFLDVFESDLKLHVAAGARRRVFVHAGVVGWKGKAIIIPGRSFSGKTTLVAELVRAGATYYSDEYAVLDSEGWVHAYPRPLSVRENGKHVRHSPEAFGGKSGRKPLRMGMVVVTRYKEGARWRPKTLSPAEGALALIENSVSIQQQPEKVIDTLRRTIPNVLILKGSRGEAKQVVDYILERLH